MSENEFCSKRRRLFAPPSCVVSQAPHVLVDFNFDPKTRTSSLDSLWWVHKDRVRFLLHCPLDWTEDRRVKIQAFQHEYLNGKWDYNKVCTDIRFSVISRIYELLQSAESTGIGCLSDSKANDKLLKLILDATLKQRCRMKHIQLKKEFKNEIEQEDVVSSSLVPAQYIDDGSEIDHGFTIFYHSEQSIEENHKVFVRFENCATIGPLRRISNGVFSFKLRDAPIPSHVRKPVHTVEKIELVLQIEIRQQQSEVVVREEQMAFLFVLVPRLE